MKINKIFSSHFVIISTLIFITFIKSYSLSQNKPEIIELKKNLG